MKPRNLWNHETYETTKPMKPWNPWNHETYETMKPMKPRNLWNHETPETMKPRNLWNHETMQPMKPWHHETYETTKPMKPRNPWNHETPEIMKPRNLRNHETHETYETTKPMKPWNHETYETMKPRGPWNHETTKPMKPRTLRNMGPMTPRDSFTYIREPLICIYSCSVTLSSNHHSVQKDSRGVLGTRNCRQCQYGGLRELLGRRTWTVTILSHQSPIKRNANLRGQKLPVFCWLFTAKKPLFTINFPK